MRQVAAIRKDTGFTDKDIVIFSWMKTCQGERERVFAAMKATQAVEAQRFRSGDEVTVGYNANSDQVILAAPGRTRIVSAVKAEVEEAEKVVGVLGWEIVRVDVPDDAPGQFQKSPWNWMEECLAVQRVLR